jgi:hypothetical protein
LVSKTITDVHSTTASVAGGTVDVVTRAGLLHLQHWRKAFSGQRKDHRYYDLVERTIRQDFEYRYFVIKDAQGDVRAIQPFLLLDQDLLAGVPRLAKAATRFVRCWWPSFMRLRTLMVGCAAGEGHLDPAHHTSAEILANTLLQHAIEMKARLVVMKEFPVEDRRSLACLLSHGFARIPSLPMTSLDFDYADFEDYMRRGISRSMRSQLRRKFRDAACGAPIEMSVVRDATPIIDEIYPLYLQVYERATLGFEKLTKDYLCEIGRAMPDKARFFVWRQSGKPIAFSLSLVHKDAIYNEYLGLDYAVALKLHLYFVMFRDIMSWAITNGYRRCVSTSLRYDPKLNLRFRLVPLDLYVRHTSPVLNVVLRWLLPLIEPTRHDRTLRKFPNYAELRGEPEADLAGSTSPPARTNYPRASSTARSEIFDQAATRSRKAR